MHWPQFFLFASDATLTGLVGGGFVLLSIVAWLGDHRRLRRKHIDAVGWMPWTTVSLLSAMTAIVLLTIAGAGWLKG
jgi:hypothetical protein